ncbi:lectin-like domain-containing protein [Enterococcus casseliflavus]|uniref:lectin-like domain-containing protein n=1 Tax=Enterococcus TaxID=1350 RepID=UPI001CD52119|nr:WxL domain-containing protein [Enterococcus casseliflavus]MDT2956045.1 WxL domain-containing protein [Enterococcus casseliflavus]MDT2959275.1 WxL domain-containing protein [Enterococcus casseliflavus]MDT2990887.1 WxL domain-containing protein [Enterococcus casseliflavus]MDV7690751.1 WxL domain-containing protein [Enterococcus casseliflavus]MDV7711758.1 WxL domain-containing protein [Enterococcus casseliflavus]
MKSLFRKKMIGGFVTLLTVVPLFTTMTILNADSLFSTAIETNDTSETETNEEPQFSLEQETLQGEVDQLLTFTFSVDQLIQMVHLTIPEAVAIDFSELTSELSVTQGEKEDELLLDSQEAIDEFTLPIRVTQSGEYTILIEEDTELSLLVEEKAEDPTEEDQEEQENAAIEDQEADNEDSLPEGQDTEDAALVQDVARDDSNALNMTVNKDNFLEHFEVHGSANYNQETGYLLLTPAANNSVGNVTLKEKLNVNQPFILKGRANIGSNDNGADGMAFGFHNSENDALGVRGNGMGLGGLTDAFGFKLDSNYNRNTDTIDGVRIERDPSGLSDAPFAGYVYHPSPNNIVTWWGNNDEARARRTGNIDGVYEPITVSYLPDETGHWFVIDYKGQTWRRDVRDWQNPEVTASSFLIAGSTGARNNLHAFMFESMTYTIGTGEVEVNYRDIDTQEEISPTAFLDEPLRTTVTLDPRSGTEDEPYLKGYDFVRVETDSENFDPATNQIAIDAERQVVTYYFKRAESEINVHYVDEDGEERAPSVQLNGYVNDEVEIPVIEIENYAFQFEADDKPLSTRHLREEQEYTLVYRMMGVPSPVDPTDPDNEVSPENPPEIDEDQGLISIDFVSQYIFGDVSISAGTATYPARPQRLLDPQGNPTEERPNYLQISDRRAINDGWTLTATMTENGFQSNEGDSLPGARILLENIEMVTNSMNQSTVPPTYNETAKIEPGIPTPIASALDNQGTGTWVQRYGDLNTMGNSVKLEVPIGADPKQATYRATIEWELRFVP